MSRIALFSIWLLGKRELASFLRKVRPVGMYMRGFKPKTGNPMHVSHGLFYFYDEWLASFGLVLVISHF